MASGANNNALVLKTVEGKQSFSEAAISTPEPLSSQALIRISHAAQNSMDGNVSGLIDSSYRD